MIRLKKIVLHPGVICFILFMVVVAVLICSGFLPPRSKEIVIDTEKCNFEGTLRVAPGFEVGDELQLFNDLQRAFDRNIKKIN